MQFLLAHRVYCCTFWSGGSVPPTFYELSQLWDDCAVVAYRLLQHFADSLDRFVEEEKVRKEAREEKWRRMGRGRQIWYPQFLAQSEANA